jgi:hypothetical protein
MTGRVVGYGPGCMDTVRDSFSADVSLDIQPMSSDGDTIASLHLVSKNQDPALPEGVMSIGIELTEWDLVNIASQALAIVQKKKES